MAVVDLAKIGVAVTIRKKLKRDMTLYPQYPYKGGGFKPTLLQNGIYQMRPRKKGKIAVRMKFYAPPETAARLANPRRAVFAAGVAAWQALDASQKEFYRLKSFGKHMSGYNVFLHEYLISN